ncbi:MAG: LysR family transcriptional regulator [Clostridia bacterium]|nr:LysR family transcriptional regulator [Clostridia bacterium]
MFREMEYVLAVYRERGFSKAARKMYLSQPALSAMVKRAEERVGGAIFDRAKTPIELTEIGREYVRIALEMSRAEEAFQQYVSDINHCLKGTLAVGGTMLFMSFILPPLLSAFSEKHPNVEVRLHETHTALLYQELSDGDLDLIVENSAMNPEIFEEKPFMTERLILGVPAKDVTSETEKYVLTASDIVSGKHLQNTHPILPLKSVKEQEYLLLKEGNDTRTRADKLFESERVRPKVRLLVDQQIMAYHLACAGMGAAFLSDTLIEHMPDTNALRFFKLDPAFSERRISFFYKKKRMLSSAARAFMDTMIEFAKET